MVRTLRDDLEEGTINGKFYHKVDSGSYNGKPIFYHIVRVDVDPLQHFTLHILQNTYKINKEGALEFSGACFDYLGRRLDDLSFDFLENNNLVDETIFFSQSQPKLTETANSTD